MSSGVTTIRGVDSLSLVHLDSISLTQMERSSSFNEEEKELIRKAQEEFAGDRNAQLSYVLFQVIHPAIAREGGNEELLSWSERIFATIPEGYFPSVPKKKEVTPHYESEGAVATGDKSLILDTPTQIMQTLLRGVESLEESLAFFRAGSLKTLDGIAEKISELYKIHNIAIQQFGEKDNRVIWTGEKLLALEVDLIA